MAILRQRHAAQGRERLAAGPLWSPHDLIVCQLNGDPLSSGSYSEAWAKVKATLEIDAATRVHDLRHTVATIELYELKTPIQVVQQMLGHSTVSMTIDTYGHTSPQLHRESSERIDEILEGSR